jgi:hypothetical protein
MTELTDLQIRKKITEIELSDGIAKDKPIEFDEKQNCYWIESAGFSSYPLLDPINDDGLCFRLMIKYKIRLLDEYYTGVCDSWFAEFGPENMSRYVKSENPNKATCLAIIESHKND